MANWKALTLISLTIGFVGIVVITVLYTQTGGYVPFDYGIVLDGGSSHSQVTLYHWSADKNRCTGVVEEVDTCRIEGGISRYNLSDVTTIGTDLLNCVLNVSKNIESDRVFKTPLYLGATAGMRLLNLTNPIDVKQILFLIKNLFKLNTGLQIESIDLISGQSEALFAWITNNYIMNKLIVDNFDDKTTDSTIGLLDMGGASAQIAYKSGNRIGSNDSDEVDIRLYGINHTVTASSNLCFGMDQAMLRYQKLLILNHNQIPDVIDNPCLPIGSHLTVSADQFKDQICVKTKNRDIDYNKDYVFNGISDAKQCADIIDRHMLNRTDCENDFDYCYNVSNTPPPEGMQFYAVSSYYYTVSVLNLTEDLTVKEYKNKMFDFCSSDRSTIANMSSVDPKYIDVYCFQLNYIYTTVRNVYRFDDKMWAEVKFADTIKSTQLGWSLGFMIDATNAIAAEKPTAAEVELFAFTLVTTFCTLVLGFSLYFALKWIRNKDQGSNSENGDKGALIYTKNLR